MRLKCGYVSQADDFLTENGEGQKIDDCFLALTGKSILLFNCDGAKIRNYRKLELVSTS
jgi:hypothetical protein